MLNNTSVFQGNIFQGFFSKVKFDLFNYTKKNHSLMVQQFNFK